MKRSNENKSKNFKKRLVKNWWKSHVDAGFVFTYLMQFIWICTNIGSIDKSSESKSYISGSSFLVLQFDVLVLTVYIRSISWISPVSLLTTKQAKKWFVWIM